LTNYNPLILSSLLAQGNFAIRQRSVMIRDKTSYRWHLQSRCIA